MTTFQIKAKSVEEHITTVKPSLVALKLCLAQGSLVDAARLLLEHDASESATAGVASLHDKVLILVAQANASLADVMGKAAE